MTRGRIRACIVIIAAACFGCVVSSSPPPPPIIVTAPLTACTSDATGKVFADSVRFVQNGYNAGPPFGAPPADTATTLPQNIHDDFAGAFAIAPPLFQTALCNLDGVYVDRNPFSGSWGFRDPTSHKRYIGLGAALWPTSGAPAISYNVYETARIQFILKSQLPAFGAAQLDNSSNMTVLAALAHEYGHIFYHDVANFCSGQFFTSWNLSTPIPPWRRFGEIDVSGNDHVPDPNSDNVSIADIVAAAGHDAKIPGLLAAIYSQKGRWASTLAAFSPDEDFVETFEFFVLTHNRSSTTHILTSLPLFVGSSTTPVGDIPQSAGGKLLFKAKKACFDNSLH
jgi:hypothetical protein